MSEDEYEKNSYDYQQRRREWAYYDQKSDYKIKREDWNAQDRNYPKPSEFTHYCKMDIMSECETCKNPDIQKLCHFYIPGRAGNCMNLRFKKFCANETLHQYIKHELSAAEIEKILVKSKNRIREINNKAAGYHLDFPLEGQETKDDLRRLWEELRNLGITSSEFWVDEKGNHSLKAMTITHQSIVNKTWNPKRKELLKDILKFIEIKERLDS